jgi:hypothetical protein
MHVTAVCYRDSRTDSIYRFSPIRVFQQKATAGPTAITNRNSRGLQPSTDVVCRKSALFVTGLVFVYIMLCTDCIQVPGNSLSSHAFLYTRKYGFLVKKII